MIALSNIEKYDDVINLLQKILRKRDEIELLIKISRQMNLNEIYKDYPEVLRRLKIVSEISAKPRLSSDEISRLILKLLAI